MSYQARHPAAFINAVSEGTKEEAVEWLQRTWDNYSDLQARTSAMVKWLNKNQPDVFNRGIWDAINGAEK